MVVKLFSFDLGSFGRILTLKDEYLNNLINCDVTCQHYPPEDWLVGSSLPSKFNPSVIQSFLNELNPDNVRLATVAQRVSLHII